MGNEKDDARMKMMYDAADGIFPKEGDNSAINHYNATDLDGIDKVKMNLASSEDESSSHSSQSGDSSHESQDVRHLSVQVAVLAFLTMASTETIVGSVLHRAQSFNTLQRRIILMQDCAKFARAMRQLPVECSYRA